MKFNKINLTLFTIAILAISTQAFSMSGCWGFFKKRFNRNVQPLEQVEGAQQEGVADEINDGPPAGFNFARAQQQMASFDIAMIFPYSTALVLKCHDIANNKMPEGVHQELLDLLKFPIDPNIRAAENNMAPLHFTAHNEQALPITNMFIKWNADVCAQDDAGKTPLHYAAQKGNVKTYNALTQRMLETKPDALKIQDKKGKTAFDYAQKHPAFAEELGIKPEGQISAFANADTDEKRDN